MQHVSRLGFFLGICVLAIVFSVATPRGVQAVVLEEQIQATPNTGAQTFYGPYLPTGTLSNSVLGPVLPVADEVLGPQIPQDKPDNATIVLDKARSLLGLPYKFGGSDPTKALDCSAFVQLVFKQVGIELPRVTFEQFTQGNPVALDQLKPGDLLFFSTNGPGPTHIGIYAGNGQFIHESPPGVQITSLANSGYEKYIVGARRVLQ